MNSADIEMLFLLLFIMCNISLVHADQTDTDLNPSLTKKMGTRMFLTTIPLSFAVLHLLLYMFYPRVKENLNYAIFGLSLSGEIYMTVTPDTKQYVPYFIKDFLFVLATNLSQFSSISTHYLQK